jgi:hypothetical protein
VGDLIEGHYRAGYSLIEYCAHDLVGGPEAGSLGLAWHIGKQPPTDRQHVVVTVAILVEPRILDNVDVGRVSG